MTCLYAAYVATWAIHIAYLGHLVRRYARLKREIEELNRKR
jgi:CcmD family protein